MRPQTIGRVLGTGVRVAGRMAGERLAGTGQATPDTKASVSRSTGQAAGRASKGLARGVKGFVRPFGHVGRKILLEVAGVFFFLFVFAFARALWHLRASALHGPDHVKFVVSACLMALFVYLTISSFWRARGR